MHRFVGVCWGMEVDFDYYVLTFKHSTLWHTNLLNINTHSTLKNSTTLLSFSSSHASQSQLVFCVCVGLCSRCSCCCCWGLLWRNLCDVWCLSVCVRHKRRLLSNNIKQPHSNSSSTQIKKELREKRTALAVCTNA